MNQIVENYAERQDEIKKSCDMDGNKAIDYNKFRAKSQIDLP